MDAEGNLDGKVPIQHFQKNSTFVTIMTYNLASSVIITVTNNNYYYLCFCLLTLSR